MKLLVFYQIYIFIFIFADHISCVANQTHDVCFTYLSRDPFYPLCGNLFLARSYVYPSDICYAAIHKV